MASRERLEAYHFYEQDWDDMEQLRSEFEWECPDEFNIASYVCDRWAANEERVAVYVEDAEGSTNEVTYAEIRREANRLASFLESRGVERGDRVGICLPPSPEVLVGHIAAWKLGAISVPLNTLFGPDALEYRLDDCSVGVCLAGASTVDTIRDVADGLPSLESLVLVDGEVEEGEFAYGRIQDEYDAAYRTATTDAEDGACIIYTSGTTGDPKGVLHAHRFLLGVLPLMCRCFVADNTTDGEVWWTPVGWSWIGSVSAVFAGLFYGLKIVAYDGGKFDPEKVFELLEKYDVTWFGGPPTMLRMMKTVENARERYDVGTLDVIGSGGEKIERATMDWANETFDGATIQDTYGQTESGPANIADFSPLVPVREGKIGVALPGNDVRIVDEDTAEPLGVGEVGEIAVRYEGNLGCFKKYWNEPEKTEAKIDAGWVLTEDLGSVDEDGYYSFETRKDDVIITSGYRVSPEEIEETLAKHDTVEAAGVIGVPHETRGEIPKAYVTLRGGATPSNTLKENLQSFVKTTLAKYEYPRELEFIDELPRTNTGKVSRHKLRAQAGATDE